MNESLQNYGATIAIIWKDYRSALADYNKAIHLKQNYIEAYNNRGVVKEKLGECESACEDYDTVIRLKPDYAEAYVGSESGRT